jgi:hypothetical protein
MKANITLRLDTALLSDIQALAEKDGTSVTAFLTAHLEQMAGQQRTYERARKRALARLRKGFDLQWTPTRSRDELHERFPSRYT